MSNNTSKKHITTIITTFVIIFNIVVFKFPKEVIEASTMGMEIWYKNLVPSLLPFIFINNFSRESGVFHFLGNLICSPISKLLKISNISSISYISALFSGYPIGSKLASDNFDSNSISKEEACIVALFSNIASPLFVLGTVGASFFKSSFLGLYLLLIQIITTFLLGITLRNKHSNFYSSNKTQFKTKPFTEVISYSVTNSISTILVIGCYVIILTILTKISAILGIMDLLSKLLLIILSPFGFTEQHSIGLIVGFFEMTSGVFYVSQNSDISTQSISVVSFVLAFGGLSINSQCISFFSKIGLKVSTFFLFKLIQALISFLLTFITYNLFF